MLENKELEAFFKNNNLSLYDACNIFNDVSVHGIDKNKAREIKTVLEDMNFTPPNSI